jgi:uncharacterized protein
VLTGLPRPRPDFDTQAFWEGCAEGRFLVPHCQDCGRSRWPPGPMCPYCRATGTDWLESSGRGRVYSWIVASHPVDAVLVDQVPYVVGLIDLEEGVRVVGNVLGCLPEDVEAEMRVELFFEDGPDGLRLPNFRATDSPKE